MKRRHGEAGREPGDEEDGGSSSGARRCRQKTAGESLLGAGGDAGSAALSGAGAPPEQVAAQTVPEHEAADLLRAPAATLLSRCSRSDLGACGPLPAHLHAAPVFVRPQKKCCVLEDSLAVSSVRELLHPWVEMPGVSVCVCARGPPAAQDCRRHSDRGPGCRGAAPAGACLRFSPVFAQRRTTEVGMISPLARLAVWPAQAKTLAVTPAPKPVSRGAQRVGTGRFDALDDELLKNIMKKLPFVPRLACANAVCKVAVCASVRARASARGVGGGVA